MKASREFICGAGDFLVTTHLIPTDRSVKKHVHVTHQCPGVNCRIRLQCRRSHTIYKAFPVFVIVNDLSFFNTPDDDMM